MANNSHPHAYSVLRIVAAIAIVAVAIFVAASPKTVFAPVPKAVSLKPLLAESSLIPFNARP